jgi:phenylpyruvate tautomerase PptA (4-oxalocrotonate tautomerase family)
MIKITHPEGTITREQKDWLAEHLTHVLLTVEGGVDVREGREIAFVLFQSVPEGDWYVGGRADDTYAAPGGRFVIDVTLPEASTNQTAKTQVHQDINSLFSEALGWPSEKDGLNAWVLINEVPEGHWGAQGVTYTLGRMAKQTGVQQDPGRIDYIKSYFTAKGKAYQVAGYPTDVSGLFRKLDYYNAVPRREEKRTGGPSDLVERVSVNPR